MLGYPFIDTSQPPPGFWEPCDDQKFAENFTSARQLSKLYNPKTGKATIAISDFKIHVADLLKELDELKTKKAIIEAESNDLSDLEWEARTQELKQIQDSISNKLLHINNPELYGPFKQKLHRRRKKRAWEKRRNAKLKVIRDQQLRDRDRLHDRIDQWRQEQLHLLEKEKQVQQELDFVSNFFIDVRRRKAVCKRYLLKFEKMREMRNERAFLHTSCSSYDPSLDSEISRLIATWSLKLSDCIKEEARLKDTLARRSAPNFQRRVENQWNRVLFGDVIPKKFEHPLLTADRDRNALISTRWSWDGCAVDENDSQDGASAIPLGWILPPAEPLPEWAEYQVKEIN